MYKTDEPRNSTQSAHCALCAVHNLQSVQSPGVVERIHMASAQGVHIYCIDSVDDDIRSMGSEGSSLGAVADENDGPDDVALGLEQHVAMHPANIGSAIENWAIRPVSDGPGETRQ